MTLSLGVIRIQIEVQPRPPRTVRVPRANPPRDYQAEARQQVMHLMYGGSAPRQQGREGGGGDARRAGG